MIPFRCVRFWLTTALAAVPALAATPGEPLAAIDDNWRHIRSPNFELYTHAREYESRTLLHDLELLRALFLGRFKLKERAKLDVTVYLFRHLKDFHAYAPRGMEQSDTKGFYQASPDRAIINLAPIEDWDGAQRLVFHEYVHHLFRITEQEPPVWFNEGMAELFSAIREERGQLEIGQPHIGRIATLQTEKLLPLETLFSVTHDSPIYRGKAHAGIFYAQSWALLHYWNFGESKLPKDSVAKFTLVASNPQLAPPGFDLRAYFKQCFGMDYPDMVKRLERYVSGGRYRFGKLPIPEVPKAASYAARPVPREELRLRLAELALRTTRSSMGAFMLVDAAAKPGAEPRIFEALGAAAITDQDPAKARDRWEQAVAAGTTNIAVLRELGLLESREWFQEFNHDFRLPLESVERLRERLTRAIQLEPEQTAAYEMLAWVEAYAEAPIFPNVNVVQTRFPLLRQQARTLVALALVRARAGQRDDAKRVLGDLDKLEWDDWAVNAGEVVLAKLENRMPRRRARPDNARENTAEISADAKNFGPRLKVPSIELSEELLTAPAANKQR
ncbi:MAG: hypothetical protein JNK23_15145 [Opitutaceae bacterium]|nr:hypothetical protein [Opitutaceae bacterium]